MQRQRIKALDRRVGESWNREVVELMSRFDDVNTQLARRAPRWPATCRLICLSMACDLVRCAVVRASLFVPHVFSIVNWICSSLGRLVDVSAPYFVDTSL